MSQLTVLAEEVPDHSADANDAEAEGDPEDGSEVLRLHIGAETRYGEGEDSVHQEPDADEASAEGLVLVVHGRLLHLFHLVKGFNSPQYRSLEV